MRWKRGADGPGHTGLTGPDYQHYATTGSSNLGPGYRGYRALRFRRGARRHASLAHFYCAFGTPLVWRCYHQILGPRRHLAKFTNGVRRYSEVLVCLNSHLIWQTPRAMWSAAVLLGLYRIRGLLTADISLALFYAADDGQRIRRRVSRLVA
jgi:hypothetical protein